MHHDRDHRGYRRSTESPPEALHISAYSVITVVVHTSILELSDPHLEGEMFVLCRLKPTESCWYSLHFSINNRTRIHTDSHRLAPASRPGESSKLRICPEYQETC
jgi:hypothetical protein